MSRLLLLSLTLVWLGWVPQFACTSKIINSAWYRACAGDDGGGDDDNDEWRSSLSSSSTTAMMMAAANVFFPSLSLLRPGLLYYSRQQRSSRCSSLVNEASKWITNRNSREASDDEAKRAVRGQNRCAHTQKGPTSFARRFSISSTEWSSSSSPAAWFSLTNKNHNEAQGRQRQRHTHRNRE